MLFLLKVTNKISCGCREIGIRQFDLFYIIHTAPNDTINSIVYNSYLKDDINIQFTLNSVRIGYNHLQLGVQNSKSLYQCYLTNSMTDLNLLYYI